MKKILQALLVTLLFCAPGRSADDPVLEPTQRTDASFRLFRTLNIFNFLKLDTRTGQLWQVQWSSQAEQRLINPINLKPLADDNKPGRFTLYPSSNIFTFLLLDQEDGRQWQIQWGLKPGERLMREITAQPN
jgi:hypothetical protein